MEKQNNLSRSPENEPSPWNNLLPEIAITESQFTEYSLLPILSEKSAEMFKGFRISSTRTYNALIRANIRSVEDKKYWNFGYSANCSWVTRFAPSRSKLSRRLYYKAGCRDCLSNEGVR